ncbi:ABC transporter permease [candidate division KSB1 bacterium]
MQTESPRIARWLLARFRNKKEHESLLGDFDEIYQFISDKNGLFKARSWYWLQVFKALPHFISTSLYWRFAMLKNYFKIAFRNVLKHKGYSFINIAGLTVGITCFTIISMYVSFETSYDSYHKDADNIYRVAADIQGTNMSGNKRSFACISAPASPFIKENFSQVENSARFTVERNMPVKSNINEFYEDYVVFADQELFEILDIPVLHGDLQDLISRPGTVIITERTAEKYFQETDPLGKVLTIQSIDYEITGVIENAPRNSHLKYDIIASIISYRDLFPQSWNSWQKTVYYTYVKVVSYIDVGELEREINEILKSRQGLLGDNWTYFLQSVKDIHLHSNLLREVEPQGNVINLIVFSVIGILVLLIACVNFVNLVTAKSSSRAKEIGLRKVVGAKRKQLIMQFLGESFLLSFIAVAAALCLICLLLPSVSEITGVEFQVRDLWNKVILLTLAGCTVFISFGGGSFPAFIFSGYEPVSTIKGISKSEKTDSLLIKYLVVFQFALSVTLIISTVVVYFQLNFMRKTNPGFDKDHKIIVASRTTRDNYESVKNEFLKHHSINGVTASLTVPGRKPWATAITTQVRGRQATLNVNEISVDPDFIPDFNFEIIAGSAFTNDMVSNVCIVNEAAVEAMELRSPNEAIDMEIIMSGRLRVVGVMKDFYNAGFKNNIEPLMLILAGQIPRPLDYLTFSVAPENLPETIDFIENKWQELNLGSVFKYSFLDEDIRMIYRTEEQMGKIISIFTFLGIIIASLGLFGLSLSSVEKRIKEIGIRKVLGASIQSIISLLILDFAKWVILGTVLAFPLAYFVMNFWLQNFAYRIDIGWFPFIVSALISIALSIITISYNVIKSAIANPVDSLKYE